METLRNTILVLLLFVSTLFACQNRTTKSNKEMEEAKEIDKQEGEINLNSSIDNITTDIITADGIELQYKIEGTGTPIIVLNGSILLPLFSNKLREQCQLIFVDARCFMPIETPSNRNSWTIETYVDDIETIRRELKL